MRQFMKIEKKLREVQDNVRNAGWRIQWIPWQQVGKLEYVFNTRMTHILNILGIGLFLTGIVLAVNVSEFAKNTLLQVSNPVWIGIGVSVLGLMVLFGGRVLAAYQKQKGWTPIEATCIDKEVAEGVSYGDGHPSSCWDYRILCVFKYKGKRYEVTPECSRMIGFNTKGGVENYLNDRIAPDGKCILYIDPNNPLHAVFDKKQKV